MLRHDHIAANEKAVPSPRFLQRLFEDGAGEWCIQSRESAVTTESDEVEMTGLLEAFQSAGHMEIVLSLARPGQNQRPRPNQKRVRTGHPHVCLQCKILSVATRQSQEG